MDVLFEYAEYKCILNTEKARICRDVQYHLRKAEVADPAVFVLSFTTNAITGERNTKFFCKNGILSGNVTLTLIHWRILHLGTD